MTVTRTYRLSADTTAVANILVPSGSVVMTGWYPTAPLRKNGSPGIGWPPAVRRLCESDAAASGSAMPAICCARIARPRSCCITTSWATWASSKASRRRPSGRSILSMTSSAPSGIWRRIFCSRSVPRLIVRSAVIVSAATFPADRRTRMRYAPGNALAAT